MRILSLVAIPLVAVVVLLALITLFQRRLIYFPVGRPPAVASILPGARSVRFSTADNLALDAWFLPPADPDAATVLMFPGNAGHRGLRAPLAARLGRHGHGVFLVDYRGYAGNPGRPTEHGLIADARAARAWLAGLPGGDSRPIVYFGESLGAGVAVALAAEQPPAGLILRSPFTSLVDAARTHYPWLPVAWLLRDRFPSDRRILGVACPLLVIAGGRDRVVPISLSRRLFDSAPSVRKHWLELPDAGHNDFEMFAGDRLVTEILRFLDREAISENPNGGPA